MIDIQFRLHHRTLRESQRAIVCGTLLFLLILVPTSTPGLSQPLNRSHSPQHLNASRPTSLLSKLLAPPQLPIPLVILSGLGPIDIGADFSFTVTFENNDPADVGYGPVIDLVFPVNGADGAANMDTADGVDFVNATYLGAVVTSYELIFPDDDGAGPGTTGCVNHPLFVDDTGTPFQVCGTAGDKLVVLELPFGSFAPNQPPAAITVNATQGDATRTPPLVAGYADLNQPLTIRSRGGFRFAADPLDNPCCDLVADTLIPTTSDSSAWPESGTVIPTLLALSKAYSGPEDETATGPNFPRRYTLTLDIATGQTVTNAQILDTLPNNMQFDNLISTTPAATCTVPSTSTPGGTLTCDFPGSVSGSASITFEYHIPRLNSASGEVIPASNGDDRTSQNNASASADWDPTDPRDTPQSFSIDVPGPEHTLNDRSIAIQKAVTNLTDAQNTPGDILQYTLSIQVSDFFAFENLVVTDVFSDGQLWDGAAPTLTFTEHLITSPSAAMQVGNYNIIKDSPGTGETTATFFLSNEMNFRGGFDGQFLGGCVPPGGTGGASPDCNISDLGPTTAVITFQTSIQDEYTDTFPSGDPSVDQGDELDNGVTILGDLLNVSNIVANGETEDDDSSSTVSIDRGQVEKTIYAFTDQSGTTSCDVVPLPAACDPVQVAPGDTVTYRIRYQMPATDVEGLSFVDYLPLPVFDATEVTTFDYTVDASVPAAGTVKFGPTDQYYLWASAFPPPRPPSPPLPTLSTNATDNSVTFTYGTFDDSLNASRWIDIMFTVTMQPEPFADGLFLTNQVRQIEDSTFLSGDTADVIIQIQIQEPFLSVRKGTVASDRAGAVFTPVDVGPASASFQPPGSAPSWTGTIDSSGLASEPVDSDASGVDAGDTVSFAVVIENLGSSQRGAFDIQVRDEIPPGFAIPPGGPNLRVTRGNDPNTLLTYTGLGGGIDGIDDTDDDFFDTGIELDDPSDNQGVCAGYSLGSGANILVITYDLILDGSVVPDAVIVNTATVQQYASQNGEGATNNFVGDESLYQDDASVTIVSPGLTKTYTSTEIDDTDNSATEAVIGEIITDYTLSLTVPEGEMPGAIILDSLDSGLAFVNCESISASPAISTSVGAGDFSDACDTFINPAVSSPGQSISFDLGDLDNDDLVNATDEIITIVYRVVVLNVAGNQNATTLNNYAELTWTGGSPITVSAPQVTVIEPVLVVNKTVLVNGVGNIGDAGDPVEYTITVQHDGASTADAYEVDLIDDLPTAAGGNPSLIDGATLDSVTDSTGLLGAADFTLSGSDAAGYTLSTNTPFDFSLTPPAGPAPRTLTFVISGNLALAVQPGSFDNTATATWTSLDTDVSTPKSTYNTNSVERTGSRTGPNDYYLDAAATVDIIAAPGKTIVTTSEPFTGTDGSRERLTIGEIVRYRLSVDIPEGTSTAFQIQDELPRGLLLLDVDQVMLSFSADADVTEAADLAGADNDAIPPTFVLPAGRIATSFASNRETVTFSLGDLINNDNDAGAETISLEFNALVDNSTTGSNDAGDDRNNAFDVLVDSVVVSTSSTVDARISEPSITDLAKTIFGTAPQDGGDVFTYRLTYSNANGANNTTAFDIRVLDTLNSDLNLVNVSVTAPGSYTDNTSGNIVDVIVDQLDPGESVTIDVQASVVNDVEVGIDIPNIADLTYTSLPGPTGTSPNATGSLTPGASGSDTGERNGSGVAPNDYVGTANLDISLTDPAISKSIIATSIATSGSGEHDPAYEDLVIGEEVTFEVTITLPEGIADPLLVTDDLPIVPAGTLELLSSQIVSIGSNVSTTILNAGDSGTPGDRNTDTIDDQVIFDFGVATNTPDGVSNADDQIVLQIVARVANIAGNQDNDQLVNLAQVDYNAESLTASATADIVEPELTIIKLADDDTPAVGQTVTYTITVAHSAASTTDAEDIIITDVVPTGLTFVSGSPSLPAAQVDESGDPTIVYTIPSLAEPGSTSFTYQAVVGTPPAVNVTDTLTNTVDMTWTSISGVDANERTGAGGVNDYSASTSEILTVTGVDLALSKDDGVLSAAPGDTLTYTLTFENIGNVDATGVAITDTVPLYTVFDLAGSTAGWSCADGALPGSICTITTPDIGSGVGVVPSGATSTIDFAVRVDASLPDTVDITSNTASIADDGSNGPESRVDNNTATHDTPLVATPDLTIVKDDGLSIVSPGSLLVFTLTFANVGDQDAVGVEIVDIVPVDTTYVDAWSSPGWTCDDPDGGGPLGPGDPGSTCTYIPNIGFGAGNIPAGNGGTVDFAIIVDDPFPVGATQVSNTATISDDGSNGSEPTPGDNTSTDTDNVVTLGNVDIEKLLVATNQGFTLGSDVAIGELVTYRLRLTVPPGTMNTTTLTDILDEGLAFVDCLSITAGPNLTTSIGSFADACNPNSAAPGTGNPAVLPEPLVSANAEDQGRRIVFDLSDVSNNNGLGGAAESITIEYQVVVLDNAGNLRGGVRNNDVLWEWSAGSLADSSPDVTILEPTLTLDKRAAPRVAPLGTPITITLTIGHAGASNANAYDLLLEDILPPELLFAGGLSNTSGVAPTSLVEAAGTITAIWDDFPLGSSSVIEFQVTLDDVSPGQRVGNQAKLEWTSLPDDGVSAPFSLSPYNSLATERRYDPSNLVDVYQVLDSSILSTPTLPETGFAPGRLTQIPMQPAELVYARFNGLKLEIPALNLSKTIVGVSTNDQGWDLTWLWNRIGFLEGTAYPSWAGNTALTGHVVLPNGLPGPFSDLDQMSWNDRIWLFANGLRYEYRVTYVWETHANDQSVLGHEDFDILTLITCADYNPTSQNYDKRTIVRAVLVEILEP